ncbi:MAG: FAD-binding protein [Alphaproteobacteria bacterium]
MEAILKPDSAETVLDAVRWAAAEETPLEIVGHGTRQGIGRPVQAEYSLDLSGLAGITLYEPAELVISARAGTPLADIQAELAKNDQELAFEPQDHGPLFGAPAGRGTIGGVLATNASGPRRIKAGAARDHVLGINAVSGRGEAFKSGGRVVKNVTGYDLPRTLAGSWGTLAVVTDLTFKVLPAAETAQTLVFPGLDDRAAIARLCAAMGSSADVSGAAHLPAGIATTLPDETGLAGDKSLTLIRLEGFENSVKSRAASLRDLFGGETVDNIGKDATAILWAAIRDCQPFAGTGNGKGDDIIWRISAAPTAGPSVVEALRQNPQTAGAKAFYDWSGGLVWIAIPVAQAGEDGAASILRTTIAENGGGHATLIRAPAPLRNVVPPFQPEEAALAALTTRMKAAFDPHGVLNPGRMGR